MPPSPRFRFHPVLLAVVAACGLGGCQSLQSSDNILGVITPYRVEIVQGNVVTSEQVARLRPGMSRAQVRDVLGTPLLTDIFHADRWDYVFWREKPGADREQRKLTVFFEDGRLTRLDGDLVAAGATQ